MSKSKRDPRDKMIERDGGSAKCRNFLLTNKAAPSTRQKNRRVKSRRANRESHVYRRLDESMEQELQTALRKLPHLRAYELKNSRVGRKPRKKMRKGSMRDRRLLRRLTIEHLLELAKTSPYTSLN